MSILDNIHPSWTNESIIASERAIDKMNAEQRAKQHAKQNKTAEQQQELTTLLQETGLYDFIFNSK